MDKRVEILDLPPDLKPLVAECELTGNRTLFTRNDRPVALLVSHDEYLALRETIAIAADAAAREAIDVAEAQVRQGALMLPEDLFESHVE
jgi:PHD/YefM family antitoxin component YafN of YafNO toxin-antitoxin module